MKKLSIMFAALAAAMAFASCEDSRDDNPTLVTFDEPKQADFLNVPVMQDQYIELTEENKNGSINLVCSQPVEYGYAATCLYMPQVSLTPDFADYRDANAEPKWDCSAIPMTNGDLAEAICSLLDVKNEQEVAAVGYQPIYVRLRAQVGNNLKQPVEGTEIYSNVVEFKHVKVGYLAIMVPGQPSVYYMRGSFDIDWAALTEYNFLTTDTKNVWEIANVTLPAGTQFKVADANWGSINLGGGDQYIFADTPYVLAGGDSPSNIEVKEDFTGKATLSMSNGAYTLLLTPAN